MSRFMSSYLLVLQSMSWTNVMAPPWVHVSPRSILGVFVLFTPWRLGVVAAARLGGDAAEEAGGDMAGQGDGDLVAGVGHADPLARAEIAQRRGHHLVGVEPCP